MDYTGEKIASFLGITSPKYAYEIGQFKKMEEKRLKEEKELKDNTWAIEKETPEVQPIVTAPARTSNDGQL